MLATVEGHRWGVCGRLVINAGVLFFSSALYLCMFPVISLKTMVSSIGEQNKAALGSLVFGCVRFY